MKCKTITLIIAFFLVMETGFTHDSSSKRLKKTVQTASAKEDGDPLIVTWSIVPDGTRMPRNYTPSGTKLKSDFITSLDRAYGAGKGGKDLRSRPWFKFLSEPLKVFESKTGLTFVYEAKDDGESLNYVSSLGIKGVRGDLRIGGISMGNRMENVRAYSGYPSSNGYTPNIVFNSAHPLFKQSNNVVFLMGHEMMHNTGMGHVLVNRNPTLTAAAQIGMGTGQGPQFDDLLGLHMRYGDRLEKNGGNDSIARATNLGEVTPDTPLRIGFDAKGLRVRAEQIDFVSIDSSADVDVFRFQVSESFPLEIELTPRGPAYEYVLEDENQRSQRIDASKLYDLRFSLSNKTGRKVEVNDAGKGDSETFNTTPIAGEYYIQVTGRGQHAQFYSLEIRSASD